MRVSIRIDGRLIMVGAATSQRIHSTNNNDNNNNSTCNSGSDTSDPDYLSGPLIETQNVRCCYCYYYFRMCLVNCLTGSNTLPSRVAAALVTRRRRHVRTVSTHAREAC